jgi:hypothetical protein
LLLGYSIPLLDEVLRGRCKLARHSWVRQSVANAWSVCWLSTAASAHAQHLTINVTVPVPAREPPVPSRSLEDLGVRPPREAGEYQRRRAKSPLSLPIGRVTPTSTADSQQDSRSARLGRHAAGQYCLVKAPGFSLLTFPQRHARDFVDNSLIRSFRFHFPCCPDIFTLWVKPRLAWALTSGRALTNVVDHRASDRRSNARCASNCRRGAQRNGGGGGHCRYAQG